MPPLDDPPQHDDAADDHDVAGGDDPALDDADTDLDDGEAELSDDLDTPELLLQDLRDFEELRAAGFTGSAWDAHALETFTYAYRASTAGGRMVCSFSVRAR